MEGASPLKSANVLMTSTMVPSPPPANTVLTSRSTHFAELLGNVLAFSQVDASCGTSSRTRRANLGVTRPALAFNKTA